MVKCIDCPHFFQEKDADGNILKDLQGRDRNKCKWKRFIEGDPQYIDPTIEFSCGYEKIGV